MQSDWYSFPFSVTVYAASSDLHADMVDGTAPMSWNIARCPEAVLMMFSDVVASHDDTSLQFVAGQILPIFNFHNGKNLHRMNIGLVLLQLVRLDGFSRSQAFIFLRSSSSS